MDKDYLEALKAMSPFELKNILMDEAVNGWKEDVSKGGKRRYLNAGRGNPNFLNTTVRESFCLLTLFMSKLSDTYLKQKDLGLRPEKEGITKKLFDFIDAQPNTEEKNFLKESIEFAIDTFALDSDEFIFEICDAALGDFYPMPPRVFPNIAKILRAYLDQVLYLEEKTKKIKFDLFCTEGATAAMVYIFNSLKINEVLHEKDEIAILTPIFSPYLEIPELKEFNLKEVFIETDENLGWQIPPKELKKLEDSRIKAFFMVHPTNPTSVALKKETIKQIGDLVRNKRPDLIVLTDTVYSTFVDDFHCILNEIPENTICVYSYSKYFGVTGWRLGVIMLSENNILDNKIAHLPKKARKQLYHRYMCIDPEPDKLKFIDRLETDSRDEALAHTGGISCPQQALMALFSLFNLMDKELKYKNDVHQILKKRIEYFFDNLEIPPPSEKENTYYYALVNILIIAEEKYGKDFAKYLKKKSHPIEFLYRLAKEKFTICLPGEGFHGPEWSIRISLANLDDEAYIHVGKNIKEMLDEIYKEWHSK